MNAKEPQSFTISELSQEFGVTTRTIRFYEDKGLISPTRQGQRRLYSSRDRVRLRLIMRGKRLGFTLDEIQEMLDLYDVDRSEVAQLKLVLDRIEERKDALMQQQKDISAMLNELDSLEKQCDSLLSEKLK